jgi:alpha-tubulin suppressor-like RCC1 family protein
LVDSESGVVIVDAASEAGPCTNGETRTVACGANDSGTRPEFCSNRRWYQRAVCSDAMPLDTGDRTVCAIRPSGQVACWGDASSTILRVLSTNSWTPPVDIGGLSDAIAVSVGAYMACGVRKSGAVACWGNGFMGDGNGHSDAFQPVAVTGLTDAVSVAAGEQAACALRRSGAIVCWGDNHLGQVGDGSSAAERLTPVRVVGISDAVALSMAANHACALRRSGAVACWGYGAQGQLGIGGPAIYYTATPTPVSGLTDAVAVSAGHYETCAVRKSGAVVCWGQATYGDLGNSQSTTNATVPVPVKGLTDAIAVAAGEFDPCAIRKSGAIVCWGQTTTNGARSTPVPLPSTNDAIAVTTFGFGCALRQSGAIACWGGNYAADPAPVIGFP